jgi:hypothetical protein
MDPISLFRFPGRMCHHSSAKSNASMLHPFLATLRQSFSGREIAAARCSGHVLTRALTWVGELGRDCVWHTAS